jgi:7,8-dihydro-6-hydroxymethylpterin dimethyltransferase
VTVRPFMDIHTMIEERLTQCCVHVGSRSTSEDGRSRDQCAPFCAVQAWPGLSRLRLSSAAGRGWEPDERRRLHPMTEVTW